MSAFSIPSIQSHPQSFIGPGLLGTFVQALQTGFLINQSLSFWDRRYEPTGLKVIVAFVSSVALAQTALGFYSTWRLCVEHFGDWVASVNPWWPDRVQTFLTMSMASPVQGFLIWRCWILTNKSWITLVPLSSLLLASIIASIVVTASVFKVDFTAPLQPAAGPAPAIPVDVTFVLSLTIAAVLDVALTTILLIFLLRSRTASVTPRFRRVLNKLITIAWEAALLPCACAIVTVITYLLLVDYNFWDLFFQAVLGKFYVISLFVTLNGRADLQRRPHASFIANLTELRVSGPEIHIGIDQSREENQLDSRLSSARVMGDGSPQTESLMPAREGEKSERWTPSQVQSICRC